MPPNPILPSFGNIRDWVLRNTLVPGDVQRPLTPPVDVTGKPEPAPVEPHEEGRPAYNPYRGSEMHGVAPPLVWEETPEGYTDGTIPVHYDDRPEGGTVLDVRVISDTKEQLTAWRVNQTVAPAVGGQAQQLVSRQRNRTKVSVQNNSATDGMWISPDPTVSAFTGWYLGPGASKDFTTSEAIYGLSNTANSVSCAVLSEYTQEA